MTIQGVVIGLMLAAAGVFSMCGAAWNWDWFLESHKARFFVNTFGRSGARVIYGVLGLALLVVGVLMALGIVSSQRKRKRFSLPQSKVEQPAETHVCDGRATLECAKMI